MNYVLICNKKNQKQLETAINNSAENLVGIITAITENIYEEVMKEYNPHGVIIANFPYETAVNFVKLKDVKAIYFVPEITLENAAEIKFMLEKNVVVTDNTDFDNLPTSEEILSKIAFLRKQELEKIALAQLENTEKLKETKSRKLYVKFDKISLESIDFNAKKVIVINEKEVEIPKGKIFVGVTELQHKIGCTHVSFEVAEYLRQQGKNVCVVIGDKNSYESMADYYGVSGKNSIGFTLDKIPVYPYEKLELAALERVWLICDFGILDEKTQTDYAETHFKIMLVAGAEWDLNVIKTYLNDSENPYKLEQNYLFYPVLPSKFSAYNRQLQRFGCKAYRLEKSPMPTQPCQNNKAVYKRIFGRK